MASKDLDRLHYRVEWLMQRIRSLSPHSPRLVPIDRAYSTWGDGVELMTAALWPREDFEKRKVDAFMDRFRVGDQAEFNGRVEEFPGAILDLLRGAPPSRSRLREWRYALVMWRRRRRWANERRQTASTAPLPEVATGIGETPEHPDVPA